MSSLPLNLSPETLSKLSGRTAAPPQEKPSDPKPSRQAQPPTAARGAAPASQRRWTVVVPRRVTQRSAQALADAEASQSALPSPPEAIRFRAQITMFGLLATVASGLYVYTEKHAAASLDRAVAHAYQTTVAAHQQTSLLRAEWALLNNPDRLHPLAGRYLSLQPLRAAQFAKIADLHSRLPKILYGPPMPPADDDVAPPIATRPLLAMAEIPAPQDPPVAETVDAPAPSIAPAAEIPQHTAEQLAAEPPAQTADAETKPPQNQLRESQSSESQAASETQPPETQSSERQPNDSPEPDRTPVVTAPAHAFRVHAHAGAMPALVDAEAEPNSRASDDAKTGLIDNDPQPTPEPRPYHQPQSQPLRQAARQAPAFAQYQPPRQVPPTWTPYQAPRQPAPVYAQNAAPRLPAHAEPTPRLPREPALLRPELVHMLMMPHTLTNPAWTAKPTQQQPARPTQAEHHIEFGRSDPPHFLSAPQPPHAIAREPALPKSPEPQRYAEARPRLLERDDTYQPPVTYRAPPAYAYRPYWNGYYGNPYNGYYAPRPVYPTYQ